ncbi:Spx/MgsR family RNA polymerase-binding regulatory protein [Alicyclobacillus sp.]|uniref:arsenate reductase family protein n=1 Tax=Alicyclobacillus sp. TaxID=61169 RepID=UPI0025B9DFBB|nr:Spx/MgsR family RNA polymerase-binding regulatory protein [Alicyclobacillus sp.]MCL6515447.1 Spx/MgsR family RNA polymerase-binding regulatory protein [Alicyclobacillus sp.]
MEFYGYRRCSTCRNAYRFLEERGVRVPFHDLVERPPDEAQLRRWVKALGQGVAPFVNRQGTRYRELGLKDRSLTEDEWIRLLAQDGKLIKRPILVDGDRIIVGFDRAQYEAWTGGR